MTIRILALAILLGYFPYGLAASTTAKPKISSSTAAPSSTTPKSKTVTVTTPSSQSADPRLLAPWTAAIFQRDPQNKNEWKFLCSGTITGRSTVITSARCLMPRVLGPKLSSRPHYVSFSDLQVVAGLPRSNLASKDKHTQFGIVGQIRDPEFGIRGGNGETPERDLAAIRLKSQFKLDTPYVKAVQLLETSGTLLEAKETKAGEKLIFAGWEKPAGVTTRSQDQGTPLKIQEIIMEDTGSCIDKYTSSYQTFYFNVLCGKAPRSGEVIPCHMEGAGLVKKVADPFDSGKQAYYLFGVYSSNTALAKTEGTLVEKNRQPPSPCTASDVIFFSKYGYLERWALSNNFCDNDLAMCSNGKCRPWEDLCNADVNCEDHSDENERVCGNQNKDCGGPKNDSSFRCKYGACINGKFKCDGVHDCRDGSDEDATGICKGKQTPAPKSGANSTASTCEGIKKQPTVMAFCSHPDRKGMLPCENPVPLGTQAVLRSKDVIVNCQRDGKWSRSTRLTC